MEPTKFIPGQLYKVYPDKASFWAVPYKGGTGPTSFYRKEYPMVMYLRKLERGDIVAGPFTSGSIKEYEGLHVVLLGECLGMMWEEDLKPLSFGTSENNTCNHNNEEKEEE